MSDATRPGGAAVERRRAKILAALGLIAGGLVVVFAWVVRRQRHSRPDPYAFLHGPIRTQSDDDAARLEMYRRPRDD